MSSVCCCIKTHPQMRQHETGDKAGWLIYTDSEKQKAGSGFLEWCGSRPLMMLQSSPELMVIARQ